MVIEHTKNIPIGEQLRQAREQQGLTLADVAEKTKFHIQQIAALEAGDLARLPSNAFVRGFVRSYAKLLQLDAAPLLAALPCAVTEKPAPEVSAAVPFSTRTASRRQQNILWLTAAGMVMLAAIGFAIWSLNTPKAIEVPSPPSASVEPTPTLSESSTQTAAPVASLPAASPVAISAASPVVITPASLVAITPPTPPAPEISTVSLTPPLLRMTFDADAWVEVRDQSGKNLTSQLNLGGSQLDLTGRAPFYLVIGNAPAVHLTYHGAAVDLAPHIRPNSTIARLKLD